jgi:hypothetical protein
MRIPGRWPGFTSDIPNFYELSSHAYYRLSNAKVVAEYLFPCRLSLKAIPLYYSSNFGPETLKDYAENYLRFEKLWRKDVLWTLPIVWCWDYV